jgi:DNA-binding IclR family transcriptional regulator
MLVRAGNGRYAPGPRLGALARQCLTAPLIAAARLKLRRMARQLGATAHMGILEDAMVTYLVKEHGGGPELLTRENNQLEAYCSGLGKVLLAHLSQDDRENYLASGPFVALTSKTITDPAALRAELLNIRRQDYARDNAEVDDRLFCLAVPVRDLAGEVRCAISISQHSQAPVPSSWLQPMRQCAGQIGVKLLPEEGG